MQQNLPSVKTIAGSGLNVKFLQPTYSTNPMKEFLNLLSEQTVSNRIRVTKLQKMIASINEYFDSNVES